MDFNSAIREWIDNQDGPFAVPLEAQRFAEHLRHTAPDVLEAWLTEHAAAFVAEAMGSIIRSRRAVAQRRHAATTFGEHAERFEAGDDEALNELDQWFAVEGTHKRFGQMVWTDIDCAASQYDALSASNAFEAAYLRAVQKRLPKNGSKTVGDVFTAQQLRSLRTAT